MLYKMRMGMCIWLRRDPFSLIHVCLLQILMKLFESIVVLSSKCDDGEPFLLNKYV